MAQWVDLVTRDTIVPGSSLAASTLFDFHFEIEKTILLKSLYIKAQC